MNFSHCLRSSLLIIILFVSSQAKPRLVVEVFRNGARGSNYQENDPFKTTAPGHLTALGLRQQYNLGFLISKKYAHLLERSDPAFIYGESISSSKCRQSLEAQMLGALQGKDFSKLPADILPSTLAPVFDDVNLVDEVVQEAGRNSDVVPYSFFPIGTRNDLYVDYGSFSTGPENCEYIKAMQGLRNNDVESVKVFGYLKSTVISLRELGYRVPNIASLAHLGDILQSMYLDGKNNELPEEICYGTTIYNDAVFANEWHTTYHLVGDAKVQALTSTNLLTRITSWFENKIATYRTIPLRFAFLSGDERSLLSLLSLYNIVNPYCLYENYNAKKSGVEIPIPSCIYPGYASQVIYELHQESEGQFVQFLYNGKPLKICSNSVGTTCNLQEFIRETQSLLSNQIPQNLNQNCQVDQATLENISAIIKQQEESKEQISEDPVVDDKALDSSNKEMGANYSSEQTNKEVATTNEEPVTNNKDAEESSKESEKSTEDHIANSEKKCNFKFTSRRGYCNKPKSFKPSILSSDIAFLWPTNFRIIHLNANN